jgi:hypothetical protein
MCLPVQGLFVDLTERWRLSVAGCLQQVVLVEEVRCRGSLNGKLRPARIQEGAKMNQFLKSNPKMVMKELIILAGESRYFFAIRILLI